MVSQINLLQSCLPNFGKALLMDLQNFGIIKNYEHKDFIVKQGQNVRYLPIVLKGNVKVYSQEDGLQFLLYYIQQGQSCIFSFTHLFNFISHSMLLGIPLERWLLFITSLKIPIVVLKK